MGDPEQDIKEIESILKDLKELVDTHVISSNDYDEKRSLDQIKKDMESVDKKINELNDTLNDMPDSNSRPLLNKSDSLRSDYNIIKNKYNKFFDIWNRKDQQRRLRSGELTGVEAKKATRDALMDQHKEIDIQGVMVKEIGKNIVGVNENLVTVQDELKKQDEQIGNIKDMTVAGQASLERVDKRITNMTYRQKCMKIIMGICVVVFGLFDIAWLIFWLVKKFK